MVIRRKQIPPKSDDTKQQDSSVADSSVSDEGVRSGREETSDISERSKGRERPRRGQSWREGKSKARAEFPLENDESRASRSELGGRARNWGVLSKSASTNGTARVFAETSGTSSSTSSSSYERDLQSLLSRPCKNSTSTESSREAGTSAIGHFTIRINDSTSSDLQEESELSSEERDALIEGVRTPSSVCRNRIPKFGTRRRIVAATGSSAKDCYFTGDRLLDRTEDPCCVPTTAKSTARQQNIHVINDVETENDTLENDTFPGDDLPGSSQKATSAPTTLSLGKKLTSWKKEGKDLLVKSVSSANTFAPTTMTCIKSPRTMSEHLLGQLDIPVAPAVPVTPTVLGALRVKGGSLKEGDREKVTEVPRQRWSSVRVKGGSTKSLLLENGGPQPPALKGALRKEVFLAS